MSLLCCQRCGAEKIEGKFSACVNCGYAAENESGNDVPIPSWVLKHVEMTPELLADIKEINFGIPPARIPIPKEQHEPEAPKGIEVQSAIGSAALKRERKRANSRSMQRLRQRSPNTYIETGQCVA